MEMEVEVEVEMEVEVGVKRGETDVYLCYLHSLDNKNSTARLSIVLHH